MRHAPMSRATRNSERSLDLGLEQSGGLRLAEKNVVLGVKLAIISDHLELLDTLNCC